MGRPRIVANLLPYTVAPPALNPPMQTNVSISAVDTEYTRVESTASSARGSWEEIVPVVTGNRYALRISVKNIVGTINEMLAVVNGTGQVSKVAGWNITRSSDGELGAIYDATTSGNVTVRFGLRPSGPGGTHPMGITVGRVQWEEIPASQEVPSEYVWAAHSAMFPYTVGNTNVGGNLVDGTGLIAPVWPEEVVFVMGDSFGNDATEWPQLLTAGILKNKCLYNYSVPGSKISEAVTALPTEVLLSPYNYRNLKSVVIDSRATRPGTFVIARGINDLLAGSGASLATMQANALSLINACRLAGAKRIIIFDLPPCKTNALSDAGKEAIRLQYNTWVETIQDVVVFKISNVLKDGADPEILSATYDTGDHLHPNATAHTAIYNALAPLIWNGWSPWSTLTAPLPLSAQPCKSHALPIGTGKITIFDGVATSSQIEEAAGQPERIYTVTSGDLEAFIATGIGSLVIQFQMTLARTLLSSTRQYPLGNTFLSYWNDGATGKWALSDGTSESVVDFDWIGDQIVTVSIDCDGYDMLIGVE